MRPFTTNVIRTPALAAILLIGGAVACSASTPRIQLTAADNFAVLAGSTVTNTGLTVITGDLGVSPGTAVTGFPPGTVSGTQHLGDGAAALAQTDLTTLYNDAAGLAPTAMVATELGGTTLNPGVYNSASGTFGITGTLTLDALGDPSAQFIFQTATTLITAGASQVVLAGGAVACNVYWQVGSSATLGLGSIFKGNILASASIGLGGGAQMEGRALASNGAVTLDTNIITTPGCGLVPTLKTTWGAVKERYH